MYNVIKGTLRPIVAKLLKLIQKIDANIEGFKKKEKVKKNQEYMYIYVFFGMADRPIGQYGNKNLYKNLRSFLIKNIRTKNLNYRVASLIKKK